MDGATAFQVIRVVFTENHGLFQKRNEAFWPKLLTLHRYKISVCSDHMAHQYLGLGEPTLCH